MRSITVNSTGRCSMLSEEGLAHIEKSPQYMCAYQLLRWMEKVDIVEDYYMVYGELILAEEFDQRFAQYVARWTDALYEDFE